MALWSLKNKKVLIIEDFQEMRVMLRSILEPLMPEMIKLCRDGEEGLEAMEGTPFDIVFCDYNLGKGKDGQQVLEEARHRQLISYSTLYIMVTAENTSEMVMGAIDYLPDDYISKPFNRTVIHNRLRKVMDKKDNLTEISKAMAVRNYKRALSLCDDLLKQKPVNQTDIMKVRGEMLQQLGRYDEAVEYYENIIEQRDIPWAYLALAKTRFLQENHIEALETLEILIRDNPSNVAAYDLQAGIHEKMGDLDKSQESLKIALEKSPKSLLRQRRYAETAKSNEDYETAVKAYERALSVGRHSCFKQADDYSALAKTLVQTGKTDDALSVIEKIHVDFDEDAGAEITAAVTGSLVMQAKGDTQAAEKYLDSALELYSKESAGLSTDAALDLTGLCLAHDKTDLAEEITRNLVGNHHDDQALIEKTRKIYSDAGLTDSGNELIDRVKDEIVDLNNDGARLLQEGRLDESIELFMKAARGMPDNVVINLNTAYSLIMQMKKTGKVKQYMPRAKKYLDRVIHLDPTNRKYPELLELMQQLAGQREAA